MAEPLKKDVLKVSWYRPQGFSGKLVRFFDHFKKNRCCCYMLLYPVSLVSEVPVLLFQEVPDFFLARYEDFGRCGCGECSDQGINSVRVAQMRSQCLYNNNVSSVFSVCLIMQ